MQFLKNRKVLAEALQKRSVKAALHERMRGWSPHHDTKVLHASDLTAEKGFCPREFALLDITKKKRKDFWADTALRATFDVGRAVEKLVREKWAGDAAAGRWQCRGCGYVSGLLVERPPNCPTEHCHNPSWRYLETNVVGPTYGISGGLDLLFSFGHGKLRLVEIKIMDKDDFRELKAPMAEHRQRTSLYLWCIKDAGPPYSTVIETQRATVLYVSRSHGFKDSSLREDHGIKDWISPFKEFTVELDLEELSPYLERASRFKHFRDTGEIPEGICASALDSRAKKCSLCKECFSGKYPPGSVAG